MMKLPWRYHAHPSDLEGIEKAKMAESIASQIAHHAAKSADEHAEIMRKNHLGPKFKAALRGHL